jgi:uncharacterized membrane protein
MIIKPEQVSQPKTTSSRLEAFSDGVLAVVITLMVLELHRPTGPDLQALYHLLPSFLIYLLSFRVIATYWNNHHHLFAIGKRITPKIMWLNMHLLFWLSLVPFFTAWLGEYYTEVTPTACYAGILFMAAVAYQWLQQEVVVINNLPRTRNKIGLISLTAYAAAAALSFIHPYIADAIFAGIAVLWFIPGRATPQKT